MEKERYYLAEKVKNRFMMVDAFNMNVLQQKGNSLEMLSSKLIKPEQIGIKLEKDNVICIDDKYKLKEVSKEEALKTLNNIGLEYTSWQHLMSGPENYASSQLNGPGGEGLI